MPTNARGDHRFDAGELLPGRYVAEVERFGHAEFVEVAVAPEPVRLVVPPPAKLRIELRDAATGLTVTDVDTLTWVAPAAGGEDRVQIRRRPEFASRSRGNRRFEIRVPVGPVRLSLDDAPYWGSTVLVEAVPGGESLVWSLRARAGVRPLYVLEGLSVPVHDPDGVTVVPVGRGAPPLSRERNGVFHSAAPGEVDVRLLDRSGAVVDSRRVRLEVGRLVDVLLGE